MPNAPSRRSKRQSRGTLVLFASALLLLAVGPEGGCRPSHARNKVKVVQELRDVCRGGDADICHSLGWLYFEGRGVRKSHIRAFRYWNLACHLGYGPSCDLMKGLHLPRRGIHSGLHSSANANASAAGVHRAGTGSRGP